MLTFKEKILCVVFLIQFVSLFLFFTDCDLNALNEVKDMLNNEISVLIQFNQSASLVIEHLCLYL